MVISKLYGRFFNAITKQYLIIFNIEDFVFVSIGNIYGVTNKKISKEIDKFSRISPASPDVSVSRNYLETIFSLPWNKETKDKLDINKAKEVLDNEHYGMEKVKERILEFLAVRTLSKSLKGPIICLVGPPGVGKDRKSVV